MTMRRFVLAGVLCLLLASSGFAQWGGTAAFVVAERTITATIADDGNLSAAVEIPWGYRLAAVVMPATWDTAVVTFTVSATAGGTYSQLYYDGSVYTLSEAAASRNITVNPVALYPWRFIKVQSGTVASAVNQTTGTTRVFSLILRPY